MWNSPTLIILWAGVPILLHGVRELSSEALVWYTCAFMLIDMGTRAIEEFSLLIWRYREIRAVCVSSKPRDLGGDEDERKN